MEYCKFKQGPLYLLFEFKQEFLYFRELADRIPPAEIAVVLFTSSGADLSQAASSTFFR